MIISFFWILSTSLYTLNLTCRDGCKTHRDAHTSNRNEPFYSQTVFTWAIKYNTMSTFGSASVCVCVSNMINTQCPKVLLHRVNRNNGDNYKPNINKAEVFSTFSTAGNSRSQCSSCSFYKGVLTDWSSCWANQIHFCLYLTNQVAHLPHSTARFHHSSSYNIQTCQTPVQRLGWFVLEVNRHLPLAYCVTVATAVVATVGRCQRSR